MVFAIYDRNISNMSFTQSSFYFTDLLPNIKLVLQVLDIQEVMEVLTLTLNMSLQRSKRLNNTLDAYILASSGDDKN